MAKWGSRLTGSATWELALTSPFLDVLAAAAAASSSLGGRVNPGRREAIKAPTPRMASPANRPRPSLPSLPLKRNRSPTHGKATTNEHNRPHAAEPTPTPRCSRREEAEEGFPAPPRPRSWRWRSWPSAPSPPPTSSPLSPPSSPPSPVSARRAPS